MTAFSNDFVELYFLVEEQKFFLEKVENKVYAICGWKTSEAAEKFLQTNLHILNKHDVIRLDRIAFENLRQNQVSLPTDYTVKLKVYD